MDSNTLILICSIFLAVDAIFTLLVDYFDYSWAKWLLYHIICPLAWLCIFIIIFVAFFFRR